MIYQGNNVVPFRQRPARGGINSARSDTAASFDQLTAAIVMERHRRGELEPELLAALLAGVGLGVPK